MKMSELNVCILRGAGYTLIFYHLNEACALPNAESQGLKYGGFMKPIYEKEVDDVYSSMRSRCVVSADSALLLRLQRLFHQDGLL